MKNRIIYSLLAAACFCLLLSCSSSEDKKERHYLKAMEYIKQEDPKAAIIELRNAIQLDASYASARYQLGLLYLEEGDPQNAFRELIRAADLDPKNNDANLKAAEFYLISRQKEECRKLVERILANDPNFADGLALLANLELIEGNFDAALAAIEKIGSDVDTSDRYLNIKGRIYAAQQKWDEAEAAFKQAIAADGEKFNNYQTLLALFQSQKEIDKAKELLDQMVERFPDLAQVRLLRANFYQTQNDQEQVEAELLKAVEIEPDNVQYRLVLANFYNNTGDQDKAEAALIQARSDIPDDPDIETALATLYFEQRQFDTSRELLDKILAAQSDHKGASLLQIRFSLKDGKNRESIAPLEKLNRDSPNWPDPYFYLGLAHFNLGEVELAQQAVVKAIQINKNNDKYHTLIAQIYQMQGQFEAAGKEASIALQLNPKNFRAALILGRSLVSDKKFEDAIKLFSEMEKQVQGNPVVLSNLALAYLGAKDRDNAEKTLNGLLEVSPDNDRAVSLLIALRYQDDLAGAEGFVKKQIEVAPDSSGLHVLLGEILARQEKGDEALAAFEKAQELAPENSQAYVAAGRLLVRLGRKDEAMAKYQAMVTQQPNSIVGLMGIATLLDADGRAAEAMEQYKKILDIKGDYAPAANNLAWQIASSADGDLGEALRYAMMAKQALPEEPHIADTLGWVHYKRKSYSLAIPQFEMALSGRPEDPVISYHLALALKENGDKEKALAVLEPILANGQPFADRDGAATLLEELKSN